MFAHWKPVPRKALSYWRLALECLLVAVFVGYGILHWAELRTVVQRISPLTLCLCMGIYTLSHFAAAVAARALFAANGYPMRYATFLGVHLQRLPAKYLPGGIWQTVGRGSDLVQLGIPARIVVQTLLLEQVLAIWWAGTFGFLLVGVAFDGEARVAAFAIASALLAAAGALVLFSDRFKPSLAQLVRAARSSTASIAYVAGWCCLASAFTCFVWLGELAQVSPLKIAASYLVSWMLGAIVFFAPQGMGIFELVMQQAIFRSQGTAEALWLIGSYRLVVLAADLAAWAAWSLWHRATSSRTTREHIQ